LPSVMNLPCGFLQSVVGGYRFATRVDVPGSRLFFNTFCPDQRCGEGCEADKMRAKAAPLQALGIQTFSRRNAFEDEDDSEYEDG
jgi:hypothetical protein